MKESQLMVGALKQKKLQQILETIKTDVIINLFHKIQEGQLCGSDC